MASRSLLHVLYDFSAEEDGELSVVAGDLVVLVDDSSAEKDGWMLVEIVQGSGQGRAGFIPTEYAAPADEGLPQEPPPSEQQQQQPPPRADVHPAPATPPAASSAHAAPPSQPQRPGTPSDDPLMASLRSMTKAASVAAGISDQGVPAAASSSAGLQNALSRSLLPPPPASFSADAPGASSSPHMTLPPSHGGGSGATTTTTMVGAITGPPSAPSLSPEDIGRLFAAHEEWYRTATLKRQETYRTLQGECVDVLRSLAEAEGRSSGLLNRISELEALIADERLRWTSRLAEDAALPVK